MHHYRGFHTSRDSKKDSLSSFPGQIEFFFFFFYFEARTREVYSPTLFFYSFEHLCGFTRERFFFLTGERRRKALFWPCGKCEFGWRKVRSFKRFSVYPAVVKGVGNVFRGRLSKNI